VGAGRIAEKPDDLARVVDAEGLGDKSAGHVDRREDPAGVQKPVGAGRIGERPDDLARVVDAGGVVNVAPGTSIVVNTNPAIVVAGVHTMSPTISRSQNHPERATVDCITATSFLALRWGPVYFNQRGEEGLATRHPGAAAA
jgi:hypothetical protein